MKSSIENHHINNQIRQETSMDAKTSKWEWDEEQHSQIISKNLPEWNTY